MKFYHIAVQRWPLPIMKKIKAIDHFWNDDETRLTVVNARGFSLSFPRMDRREIRLYPNYKTFHQDLLPKASPQPVLPVEQALEDNQWPAAPTS
jgi:hypothetical protein